MMGEGFIRTVEDIQVDMQSSPEQSCHQQDLRSGQNTALEGPRGRKGPGRQRLHLVLRMPDQGQHKVRPTEKIWVL